MKPTGGLAVWKAQTEMAGVPQSVLFQVTDRCNYRCVHCYETHGTAQELGTADVLRILHELADAGVLFLTFTGGEFFMRRDADELLAAARKLEFAVKLLTTGHFIDDRRADFIAELGVLEVSMSLYGADAATHEAITVHPGSFERTVAAALRLRARGVPVLLKTPVMSTNSSTWREFIAFAQSLDCRFALDPLVTGREDGEQSPTALRPDDEALRAFYREFGVDHHAPRFERAAGRELRPLDQTPCAAGQTTCRVNPQGLVFPCSSLPTPVGDLQKQPFSTIWRESPELQRLRGLTWDLLPICRTCDVRQYCSRCHAMALLEDGDLLGPSTEACRHAVVLRDALKERGMAVAEGPAAGIQRNVARRPSALRVLSTIP
jgi:radical SAM protein with 4Fe4S-binding SPASM domain